jgi:hypothetical protein
VAFSFLPQLSFTEARVSERHLSHSLTRGSDDFEYADRADYDAAGIANLFASDPETLASQPELLYPLWVVD